LWPNDSPPPPQGRTIPLGDSHLQSSNARTGLFWWFSRNRVLPHVPHPLGNPLLPFLGFSCTPTPAPPPPLDARGTMTTMQRILRDNPSDE
jgi:hypothetical protein